MKITVIILCCFVFFTSNLHAQDQPAFRTHLQGYNVVFPGLEVAYQYPVYNLSIKEKHQLLVNLAPVADFYIYRGNHAGIGLTGELNLQYMFRKSYLVEAYGGFGVLGAVLSGVVYELNDAGEFEESRWKGNLYSNWKTGLGFGKMMSLKSGKYIMLHIRGGIRRARTPGAFITPNISGGLTYLFNQEK